MTVRLTLLALATGCCLTLWTATVPGQTPAQKTILLNVGQGQLPPDTGMDDKTKAEIVDDAKELGGKALKVPFTAGDSFGARVGAASKNWKRFAFFRCDAVNPSQNPVSLELVVLHGRSSSYQTRVVFPIKLRPGKNEVKIGTDEMKIGRASCRERV